MELGAVIVYVDVVPPVVDFYRRAFGFEVGDVAMDEYAEVRAGSMTLIAFAARSFVEQHLPGHGRAPEGFELALVAEDVQTAFDRAVAEGAEPVSPPAEKPWGQVVSYVRAPEGTLVEISSEWRR